MCCVCHELSKVSKIEADCCKFVPFLTSGDICYDSSDGELPLISYHCFTVQVHFVSTKERNHLFIIRLLQMIVALGLCDKKVFCDLIPHLAFALIT